MGSVLTTTGYATADFNVWPGLSRAILFALMFIGGCAGSTAGGLKVSRALTEVFQNPTIWYNLQNYSIFQEFPVLNLQFYNL